VSAVEGGTPFVYMNDYRQEKWSLLEVVGWEGAKGLPGGGEAAGCIAADGAGVGAEGDRSAAGGERGDSKWRRVSYQAGGRGRSSGERGEDTGEGSVGAG
jgi:hypothetical protein